MSQMWIKAVLVKYQCTFLGESNLRYDRNGMYNILGAKNVVAVLL